MNRAVGSYVVNRRAQLDSHVMPAAEKLAVGGNQGGSDLCVRGTTGSVLRSVTSLVSGPVCSGSGVVYLSYRNPPFLVAELGLLEGDGESLCVIHAWVRLCCAIRSSSVAGESSTREARKMKGAAVLLEG